MGRRSDHSRDELETLILDAGQQLIEERGFAQFSAREVAKRIGYSVGTLMHMFDGVDGLLMAINSRSFLLWADTLERRLRDNAGNRIHALVTGYFAFAQHHPNLWRAIYEHRLPEGVDLPPPLADQRARLTVIVMREIAAVLPNDDEEMVTRLGRSLIATVHGHCTFMLNGSFALLGETAPLDLAIARVDEILHANGARSAS